MNANHLLMILAALCVAAAVIWFFATQY